ncbi:MAG: hypothetical protein K6U00_08605 [Armatimonadetes bacterium]|nr:hypothetical protein [Armatimonadota bacterium]
MLRYEGVRWKILYGSYEGTERFALNELQRIVQLFHPYVLRIEKASSESIKDQDHLILVGTTANNPLIQELVDKNLLPMPARQEGYSIACFGSPWGENKRVIAIAGYDANGVLYGVIDFCAHRIYARVLKEYTPDMRNDFDHMPDFMMSEYPLIDNRGIWTWGYVIYDYRRFLDNMARLKMNMLTIWNDCPPVNAKEIVDYAHSRGIRIVMGFHWGWGIPDLDPTDRNHLEKIKREVVNNYIDNYRHLGIDGVYFQTFTETHEREIKGRRIASLACQWVNEISAALYEIEPDLSIQFGLHATSILENYTDLAPLDPRITIVWEDAGVLPYAYHPVVEFEQTEGSNAQGLTSFQETVDYSKRLVSFRQNRDFAMVPKGWMNLRWTTEFENHGPFILGERDAGWIRKRLQERQPLWDQVNTLWLRNYPYAARFYREILNCKPTSMTVTGLIEDGLLEEAIQISVAIFGETIWNPYRDDSEILELAFSPYYRART